MLCRANSESQMFVRRVKCLTSTELRGRMLIFHVSGSVTIVIYSAGGVYEWLYRDETACGTAFECDMRRDREGTSETKRRDYGDRERVNFPHWKWDSFEHAYETFDCYDCRTPLYECGCVVSCVFGPACSCARVCVYASNMELFFILLVENVC